jgi:hypothetical protein
MATVINNPRQGTEDSGMGLVLGVIIAIVLIALFWIYALPAIRNVSPPTTQPQGGTNINVQLPNPSGGGTNAPSNNATQNP